MNLPVDTHVAEGEFLRVTIDDGSSFFIESQYLGDLANEDAIQSVEKESGTFAAVNEQDPEGNGIDNIFATEAEAEAHLIERYGREDEYREPDEDPYEGDSSGFNPPQYA